MNLLATVDLAQTVSPSAAAWSEAGMIAGILARAQHLNRSRKELTAEEGCCQDGKRRKLLNDALIFLSAAAAQIEQMAVPANQVTYLASSGQLERIALRVSAPPHKTKASIPASNPNWPVRSFV